MPNPAWPLGEINFEPLVSTWSEVLSGYFGEFQPDVGLPTRWARSASVQIEADFRLMLSGPERAALIAFYCDDCKSGALPFDMIEPVSGVGVTWQWAEAPRFVPADGHRLFTASLRLRRIA